MPDLQNIFSQALARGAKSNILRPLAGLIITCLSGALIAFASGAPSWFGTGLALLGFISIIFFLGAFGYFSVKDPDRLQSEKFSIQKIAIEKGLVGDDETGFRRVKTVQGAELVDGVSSVKALE